MNTTPISSGSVPLPVKGLDATAINQAKDDFSKMLSSTIAQVNHADLQGDSAIAQLHAGGAKNLHEVMIATEEADISIRMLVQMRNKALEAYNEIMKLQI